MTRPEPCPCGSGAGLAACCGRLHARFARDGALIAPTAEALMRSRYTAFARLGEAGPAEARAMADYLAATWAPEHRPTAAELLPVAGEQAPRFTRLAVLEVRDGGPFQDAGTVEFVAVGTGAGGRFRLHEVSRFRREDGIWRYVDGDVR
ncbi:YchJ family protein [Micrococcus luteus]|uniref:YchJ family protein n=1 Tax=Micrococcus luteus TaxID=1270 RepID=UPI00342C0EE3